jgi:molybdate transport system substrate-binding protein
MTALGRLAGLATASVLLLAGCSTSDAAEGGSGPVSGASESDTGADAGRLDGEVTVFAAASLTGVFDTLAERFEQENPGVDVVLNFGGSSGLAEQIVQGAPADVFASADAATMDEVAEHGLVTDPVVFASNTLEIAVPAGNPAVIDSLEDLARDDVTVALCDVAVPCGAATAAVFAVAGVDPAPDTLEQDVRAVLTKVRLGEVDAGLVYLTDVLAAGEDVEGIEFDEAADAVNEYPIAALADAPDAAAAFVAFVLGDDSRAVLDEAGFGGP